MSVARKFLYGAILNYTKVARIDDKVVYYGRLTLSGKGCWYGVGKSRFETAL